MTEKEISNYYTDEHITRLVATQVIAILLLTFLSYGVYIAGILVVDFGLRAFTYLTSPLAFIAKFTSNELKLKPKPVFVAPKKFAASIGFVFSLAILTLLLLKYVSIAHIVAILLIFFAFLEAVFKICVGCYVHSWLVAPIANKQYKK